jgi:tripartite-type tricarboxylate transporter receptor subunit TctC
MREILSYAALGLAVLGMGASSGTLAQQAYPSRPIRILLPQPPGAGVDIILRRAAEGIQPRLGQALLLDNRPGGNSVIAADLCAKAVPDGYTACSLNVDALATNPNLFLKLPYDPAKDLRPVTNLYTILGGVFAKMSLPANTARELQALAVAKPGALNFGTLGPNTINDMSRMWLADLWKTSFASIPYKGGPPIFTALVAGEIDLTYQGVYGGLGLLEARKIKLLAVSGSKRLAQFPDVPTLAEFGAGDLPSASAWWGLGYKIESRFFGLIQSIILYQRIQQGIAKYPPVHISALTREEKSKLIRSLNQYSPPV